MSEAVEIKGPGGNAPDQLALGVENRAVTLPVSIIIAAYNCATTLRMTVESVVLQVSGVLECIIVDDGSTDDTLRVARCLEADHGCVRVLTKANGGPSSARNVGWRAANCESEYIWFLDSDDLLHDSAVREMVQYLDAHADVLSVGCANSVFSSGSSPYEGHIQIRSRYVPGRIMPRKLRNDELPTPFVTFLCETGQGPFYLFRKSVLGKVNGYDEDLWAHEDADLLCRVALQGTVHYLPTVLYFKRERPGSMTSVGQEMGSAVVFRKKWSARLFLTSDPEVLMAMRYKSTRHVPYRDLKVAAKSFSELLRGGGRRSVRQIRLLLWSAMRGFSGYNWYFKIES